MAANTLKKGTFSFSVTLFFLFLENIVEIQILIVPLVEDLRLKKTESQAIPTPEPYRHPETSEHRNLEHHRPSPRPRRE